MQYSNWVTQTGYSRSKSAAAAAPSVTQSAQVILIIIIQELHIIHYPPTGCSMQPINARKVLRAHRHGMSSVRFTAAAARCFQHAISGGEKVQIGGERGQVETQTQENRKRCGIFDFPISKWRVFVDSDDIGLLIYNK